MTTMTTPRRNLRYLLVPALLLAVPAVAEERSAEGLEILEKADAATKKVQGVSYQAVTTSEGWAANFIPSSEGEGVMYGWAGRLPEHFYAHVVTSQPGSGEEVELTGGGNGESFYIIDHANKKAYEDMDPGVMGSGGRVLQGFGMLEFVHDSPFDDELNAERVEFQGEETVNGVPCYKIEVGYGGGQGISTWYFSKDDYLPRRRVRHINDPNRGGEASVQIDITRLEIDPPMNPTLFKLSLPEGYEQIDDFMP